jgi:hypothetical protein
MIALRRPEAETSLCLLLPPGRWPALVWEAAKQVDAFVLIGWTALARGAWRREQTNLVAASTICGLLWLAESALRVGYSLVVGAGMRLTVLPE